MKTWAERITIVSALVILAVALMCMVTGCGAGDETRQRETRTIAGVVVGSGFTPGSSNVVPTVGFNGKLGMAYTSTPEHYIVAIRTAEGKFTRDSKALFEELDPGDSVVVAMHRDYSKKFGSDTRVHHWYDLGWQVDSITKKGSR